MSIMKRYVTRNRAQLTAAAEEVEEAVAASAEEVAE